MHLTILGGTRFIGHALARHALAAGARVTLIHRGKTPCEVSGVTEVIADRNDPALMATVLAKARPDVVVDTWAMSKSGAESVAVGLKMLRVPAVVLSSQDVYAQFGKLNGLPAPEQDQDVIDENSPLAPPRPFDGMGHEGGPDYDKKDVEAVYQEVASATGAPTSVMRLPAVYGPRDYRRRFGEIVDRLDRGSRDLPCVGGATLRLTHAHVTDVAEAIWRAAKRTAGGFRVFNVGEEVVPTMGERALRIAEAMGVHLTLHEADELPRELGLLGKFPCNCSMSTTRIRRELGFAEVLTEAERLGDLIAALRTSRAASN